MESSSTAKVSCKYGDTIIPPRNVDPEHPRGGYIPVGLILIKSEDSVDIKRLPTVLTMHKEIDSSMVFNFLTYSTLFLTVGYTGFISWALDGKSLV